MLKITNEEQKVELHIHNVKEVRINFSDGTLICSSTEEAIDTPKTQLALGTTLGAIVIALLKKLLDL